jgi:hypothetical protein
MIELVAAGTGGGMPAWFLAIFIPLFLAGAVLAVLMFRREGWRGATRSVTGRGSYRPKQSVWLGMVGIVLGAVLHQFWVAFVVVVPVILYSWWRFWQASDSGRRT